MTSMGLRISDRRSFGSWSLVSVDLTGDIGIQKADNNPRNIMIMHVLNDHTGGFKTVLWERPPPLFEESQSTFSEVSYDYLKWITSCPF